MSGIEIRPLRAEDLEAAATLWHAGWHSTGLARPDDLGRAGLRDRLAQERSWQVRLAWDGAEIVGLLAYEPGARWLRQLFVRPDRQGGGIGTLLLEASKRAMPDGFALRTELGNAGARRFYERRGLHLEREARHPTRGHLTAIYVWP